MNLSTSSVPRNGAHVNDVVSVLRISRVYETLGGPRLRHRRGPAFWRPNADNLQAVSVNDDKGVWHDFVANEGGGVLALIRRVTGYSKAEALRWAADLAGVPLDTPLSPEQRREYARRARAAEAEARELVEWRQDQISILRSRRNGLLATYHAARRFLYLHTAAECSEAGGMLHVRYECALTVESTFWSRIEDFDEFISMVDKASFETLLPLFRSRATTEEYSVAA